MRLEYNFWFENKHREYTSSLNDYRIYIYISCTFPTISSYLVFRVMSKTQFIKTFLPILQRPIHKWNAEKKEVMLSIVLNKEERNYHSLPCPRLFWCSLTNPNANSKYRKMNFCVFIGNTKIAKIFTRDKIINMQLSNPW